MVDGSTHIRPLSPGCPLGWDPSNQRKEGTGDATPQEAREQDVVREVFLFRKLLPNRFKNVGRAGAIVVAFTLAN